MFRLVLIDHDESSREALTSELKKLAFEVASFADHRALLEAIESLADTDTILLNWQYPEASGAMRSFREKGVFIPVIVLDDVAETADENKALDLGAVDFVPRSRGIEVLARRIGVAATVRRLARPDLLSESFVECGRLTLKPRISRAYWDGHNLDLTVSECKIVRLLVESGGVYVTYESIYGCVDGGGSSAHDRDGYRTNVRSFTKRIRKKFLVIDPDFSEIENFASFGYRWRGLPDPARLANTTRATQ